MQISGFLDISAVLAFILMAAILRGFSGFGFSLAAVPLVSLIIGLKTTIPVILAIEFFNILPFIPRIMHALDRSLLSKLVLGAALGLPMGLFSLNLIPASLIGPLVACFVMASVVAIWRQPPRPASGAHRPFAFPVGLVSGFLNGSTGMSGPPIILFILSGNGHRDVARATMLAFFPISGILTVAAGLWSKVYETPSLLLIGLGIPVSFLGTEIGLRLAKRVSDNRAKRISLAILFFSALASLVGFISQLQ